MPSTRICETLCIKNLQLNAIDQNMWKRPQNNHHDQQEDLYFSLRERVCEYKIFILQSLALQWWLWICSVGDKRSLITQMTIQLGPKYSTMNIYCQHKECKVAQTILSVAGQKVSKAYSHSKTTGWLNFVSWLNESTPWGDWVGVTWWADLESWPREQTWWANLESQLGECTSIVSLASWLRESAWRSNMVSGLKVATWWGKLVSRLSEAT